jgi:hypothetical protein
MAQAHRSSQITSGTGYGGPKRSSATLETQEMIMLLRRFVTSTSSRVVGSMTQASTLTGSAIASQTSTMAPPSTASLVICPCILDSDATFYI